MGDLIKHDAQELQTHYPHFEGQSESQDQSSPNVVGALLHRWYIVLLTFVLISAVGVPAVWISVKPKYEATAAIRVAPTIERIVFADKDSEGVMPKYENFVNTQAVLITSDQVLERVADDLVDEEIQLFQRYSLFSKKQMPVSPIKALKEAVRDGVIVVAPIKRSELINISMKSRYPREAVQIVDALVRAYMAIEGSKSAQGGNKKLEVLESERRVMMDKLQRTRETIRRMAEEYGTTTLTGRQEMMLTRVSDLLRELTRIEARKLALQSTVQMLQQTNGTALLRVGILERRYEFINSDLTLQTLTQRVAQMEEGLVEAQQTLAATNPELQRQTEMLGAFEDGLSNRRKELEEIFEGMIVKELEENSQGQLAKARSELEQAIAHENILKENLDKQDFETKEVGRKQLDIQDEQEDLALIKELYNHIRQNILELQMERQRQARITVANNASSVLMPSKRKKLIAAMLFGALACGVLLAFLRDKADNSLYTPDDIIQSIGIPVIGTTTNLKEIDDAVVLEHVAYDYQTIRANLRLLSNGSMPKVLVVTSPGIAEGKTTLAINLASSLAQAGNKVLLIDGDLRKPDVGHLLNLPAHSWGITDVLLGLKRFDQAIHTIQLTGLDILTSDSRNNNEAIEKLSQPDTVNIINDIRQHYDHVIIDTPPVLAIPDALLWCRACDAVVLSSYSGHSDGADLKKALERLIRMNVRVLGNVLCAVPVKHSYNRYGYDYYGSDRKAAGDRRRHDARTLLSSLQSKAKEADESIS